MLIRVLPTTITVIIALVASVNVITVVGIQLQQGSINQASTAADSPSALLDDHTRYIFILVVDGVESSVIIIVLLVREEILEGIVVDALAIARILFEKGTDGFRGGAPVRS